MTKPAHWQEMLRLRILAAVTLVAGLHFGGIAQLKAQSDSTDKDKGMVLSESFQGSSSEIGTILKLDTMAGYKFNRYFEVDAGLPVYFVRASAETAAAGGASGNGIGNAYFRLKFLAYNSTVTYQASITASAPTGNADKGFSTGRVTVDWNNYLGFTAGRFTPFVNAGLANSISDTHFFTRPFSSLGKVAHLEGGLDFQLFPMVSIGGSAYADEPFGEQKIYSRVTTVQVQGSQPSPGRGVGSGRMRQGGVFQTQRVTIGTADLLRDSGGSVWLDITPPGIATFEVGYSRSSEYDLNSVFFSIGLDFGSLIRAHH